MDDIFKNYKTPNLPNRLSVRVCLPSIMSYVRGIIVYFLFLHWNCFRAGSYWWLMVALVTTTQTISKEYRTEMWKCCLKLLVLSLYTRAHN